MSIVFSFKRAVVSLVIACFFFGCSGRDTGEARDPSASDAGTERTKNQPADAGLHREDGAPPRAKETGPESNPSTSSKVLPTCGLTGAKQSISEVLASDMVVVGQRPIVLAILSRPRSEPLDLEGSEPLPPIRSLYLIAEGGEDSSGDQQGESSGLSVTHIIDDPGPVRDHFGRRMYERLVDVKGVCDGSGCLVAIMVERQTPGTEGSAFTALVETLDDQGVPLSQGAKLRRLSQEPDRGGRVVSCLGASNEGFLLATAVEKGRGRLLWMDRRATPLDMSYLSGGFESCTAWPLGLQIEVAVGRLEGVAVHGMGREESSEPDGGPGPWRPQLGDGTRSPVLVTTGADRVLLYSDEDRVRLATQSPSDPVEVFDRSALHLAATPLGDELLVASLDESKQVALALVDPTKGVTARTSDLVKAERVWALASEQGAWLGWREGKGISYQRVECPQPSTKGGTGASLSMPEEELQRAEQRSVKQLLSLAREARSLDQNYRAAWLLERAYHFNPSDPERMVQSAGLLTQIRYTKSALRQLERLSKLSDSKAGKALRTACNDRDFKRLWPSGEFQRITGCRSPAEPPPDGGVEDEDPPDTEEPEPSD